MASSTYPDPANVGFGHTAPEIALRHRPIRFDWLHNIAKAITIPRYGRGLSL
ncbi:MAG: hypothetical protein ACK4VZ_07915 [Paracoccaceae bacterium]